MLTTFNYEFNCNYNAVKSLQTHLNKFASLYVMKANSQRLDLWLCLKATEVQRMNNENHF